MKTKYVSIKKSFLLILLSSFVLVFFMFFTQTNGLSNVLTCITNSNFLTLILNWFPILMFMLILFFLLNNTIVSIGVVFLVVGVMSVINRLKIVYRSDPFLPTDLILGTEALTISKSFGIKAQVVVVAGILLAILSIVVLALFIKNKKLNLKYRAILLLVTLIFTFFINKNIYANQKINSKLFVIGNIYNQVDIFDSKGFLYSFIYAFNTNKIEKPNDYDKKEIYKFIDDYDTKDLSQFENIKRPHVIMIMGEAFSDIALNEKFDFTGYDDPLKNYKNIIKDSITGHIVTPNIGGGTADTEFDVLTGINTRHFRGTAYSYLLVTKDYTAIPSIFSNLGYGTVAIHPGHLWFYNRINVYKYFGFDKFYHMKDFDVNDTKGMYITEKATFDRIIHEFDTFRKENPKKPYFNFTVTIQNHGPYPDKYLSKTNFSSTANLSEVDTNGLSNYFEGVVDADRELGRLIDYLNTIDEPVVVVYFGDHLPALGKDVYEEFVKDSIKNTADEKTIMYETPFIIWENNVSKSENILKVDENMPKVMSSNYLGVTLLEMLGFENSNAYFDYLLSIRNKYPIILEREVINSKDEVVNYKDENDFEDLDFLRQFEYYNIFEH